MRYDQDRVLRMLGDARKAGASDIHIKVPGRPRFRVDRQLVATPHPPLTPEDSRHIAHVLMALANVEYPLARLHQQEFSFGLQRVGRFRVHLYRQRGSLAMVVHRMALEVPSLHDLGAPAQTGSEAWDQPGLVLATGQRRLPSLLAALVDDYNQRVAGNLVVVEDMMEFLHTDKRASIAQREVEVDVPSFSDALKGCMREDPDAVLVGDLPDAEAAELALRLAETGRSVVAGVVGCRGDEVARRFARMFPPYREREIASRLDGVLRMVVEETEHGVELHRAHEPFVKAV